MILKKQLKIPLDNFNNLSYNYLMFIKDKLAILADAAKYDVSCSASSRADRAKGANGKEGIRGVCHSWTADGRCVSLLKVLLSNDCIYDCAYCSNRSSVDKVRTSFTPNELATLATEFYRRNYIDGLFLSSGVVQNPDYTMEQLIATAKLLRGDNFMGYIHMKAIPGASQSLLQQAGFLVDRMSANIELPSERSLVTLAPQKNKKSILGTMTNMRNNITEISEENKRAKKKLRFMTGGQSTQLIVGATEEDDATILKLSSALYKSYSLKRVFYSAFSVATEDVRLPSSNTSLMREHRLYQADWLYRFYGFSHNEIISEGNLDTNLDPKAMWATRNPQFFPVDVMTASKERLLRVPGIGVLSARQIVASRRHGVLTYQHLKKIGVVLKRAEPFILSAGRRVGETIKFEEDSIKTFLTKKQLELF